MDNILGNGSKIKFMYEGKLLYGEIVGNGIEYTDNRFDIKILYCQIVLDKNLQCGFVGLYNSIDLSKDINLCDDGYYTVHLYNKPMLEVSYGA